LDTVRVLVQTNGSSLSGSALGLWRSEGIPGLFKGMLSPLISVGLWKAVMFSSCSHVVATLKAPNQDHQPAWHVFIGGMAAGTAGLSVQTPFERIKVVTQTSPPPPGTSIIRHELNIGIQICQREGIRGLYRGTLINATLCPLAIGVWFGLNESLNQIKIRGRRVGILEEFLCGATAGTLAWAVNYPSDKAKAIIQATVGQNPTATTAQLLKPHLHSQGISFVWKGMGATLLRSVPQTGATIVAYSQSKKFFSRIREHA